MPNGHNSIKRLAHRAAEEVKSSCAIGKACGASEGFNAFRAKLDLQVMNRNGYAEPPAVRSRLVRKHEAVMTYLEKLMGDYAESYDYGASLPPVPDGMGGKIWMCWWQGLENAPEIVKACIDSVRRNAAGREVIVITEGNMGDYIDIPGWMLDKVRNGIASRTNLSDLLRLSLLARYGGIWLDATFFCCRPLNAPAYSAPLFSIKRPDYLHGSIAGGYFAGYSWGCSELNRYIFAAARDLFLEYWRRSDYLIDYLLVDYLIVMVQRHCPDIAAAFDNIEPNNPACDELFKILSESYDDAKWSELFSSTDLFKLTWKQDFPKQVDGRQTFYGKLVEEGLA